MKELLRDESKGNETAFRKRHNNFETGEAAKLRMLPVNVTNRALCIFNCASDLNSPR